MATSFIHTAYSFDDCKGSYIHPCDPIGTVNPACCAALRQHPHCLCLYVSDNPDLLDVIHACNVTIPDPCPDVVMVLKLILSWCIRRMIGFFEVYDKSVNDKEQPRNDKEFSSDPFNIYNLLNKKNLDVNKSGSDFSLSHPPGFTLEKDNHSLEDQEVNKPNLALPQCHSEGFNSRVMQDVSPTVETIISDGNIKDRGR
ncbi:hypothetical protein Tco_0674172 [Tanacetum coccineum]